MKGILIFTLLIAACSQQAVQTDNTTVSVNETFELQNDSSLEIATFAGGCFWCMEADFEYVDGVMSAVSGYTGGNISNPTYQTYNKGENYHIEAVQIVFDSEIVNYSQIVEYYYLHIDPTDPNGMFVDRGPYYSSAIWYHSPEQQEIAQNVTQRLNQSGVFEEPIVTPIQPAVTFWPAEEYHQDYYKKNPRRYGLYRSFSGRNGFQETTQERYVAVYGEQP